MYPDYLDPVLSVPEFTEAEIKSRPKFLCDAPKRCKFAFSKCWPRDPSMHLRREYKFHRRIEWRWLAKAAKGETLNLYGEGLPFPSNNLSVSPHLNWRPGDIRSFFNELDWLRHAWQTAVSSGYDFVRRINHSRPADSEGTCEYLYNFLFSLLSARGNVGIGLLISELPLVSFFDRVLLPKLNDWNARWRTSDVDALARGILENNDWDRMPILGDALMDAGCEDENLIGRLRNTCWPGYDALVEWLAKPEAFAPPPPPPPSRRERRQRREQRQQLHEHLGAIV